MTIVVRAVFLENDKYYLQVFLDVCLYQLQKWKVEMNQNKLIPKIVRVITLMIQLMVQILILTVFY